MYKKKKIRIKKDGEKKPAKVTAAQVKRANKVRKEGSKATTHVTIDSKGDYKGAKNPSIERRVKSAEALVRKHSKRKGSPEYNKAMSSLKKAKREQSLHNRSASRVADVAKAQESGFSKGKYSERLRQRQNYKGGK